MRYAVYFTPAHDDPLTVAAQTWLGRDAFADAVVAQPTIPGVSPADLPRFTADPRRYGFHATLVAPFRLRDGMTDDALAGAADAFAATTPAFDIPRLAISRIAAFLALTPADPCPPLEALAAAAVDHFSGLRAPLTPAEIERRQPARLSERQRAYLTRYGYPFVKDEFRFHMTLTGALEPDEDALIGPALDAHFAPLLAQPVRVDALAIFVEPEPGAAFRILSIHRFGAAEARKSA